MYLRLTRTFNPDLPLTPCALTTSSGSRETKKICIRTETITHCFNPFPADGVYMAKAETLSKQKL
jgi:hypothetical protein